MSVPSGHSIPASPKTEGVLITSNFSNTTGLAWNFFFRLFNVLARHLRDKNLSICLSFAAIEKPVRILDDDIPFHAFVFDPLNISVRGLLKLKSELRRHNIRYVYLTDYQSWHWLYALLRFWGVRRIVVHSHISVPDPNPPPTEKGVKKAIKTMIHATRILRADAVYACSHFVKDRLVRKGCCPTARVTVIPHGIDTDRFNCPQGNENRGAVRVVSIARATKYKGVHILLEATSLLRSKYGLENFTIDYGGDGDDLQEFKKMAKELRVADRFHFLGHLDDTRDTVCSADIIVVPSIWGDAFPLSVLEAMAAGKALIATRVGGIPEQVGDGPCAVLIPPSDGEILARELAQLILDENKRLALGQAARQRAERLFREEIFHEKVIAKLLTDFGLSSQ